MELTYDPLISLLGIYSEQMKTGYQKDICTPMFISVLFLLKKNYGSILCVREWMNAYRRCDRIVYTME